MPTIKMLKDTHVSPNGFDNEKWLKDEIKEDVSESLAADLCHPLTLAAVEVTGNKKADEKAELDALAEQEKRDQAAAAQKALEDAAAQAALAAAGGNPQD